MRANCNSKAPRLVGDIVDNAVGRPSSKRTPTPSAGGSAPRYELIGTGSSHGHDPGAEQLTELGVAQRAVQEVGPHSDHHRHRRSVVLGQAHQPVEEEAVWSLPPG